MWWNDIKDIKESINKFNYRLLIIEGKVDCILGVIREKSEKSLGTEGIEECLINIRDAFCPDDEYSSINIINDKLNLLVSDKKREESVILVQKTLDKFDDYMKNVDKINIMVNEFKGCVSMARGAISDKKEMDDMRTILKNMLESCNRHYNYEKGISNKNYKIDAIYEFICEAKEKKSPKKRKIIKKKALPASSTQ